MAQTGYTPILIYASGTATNVPLAANLTSSAAGAELALNYYDGKLYYKDNAGVVQLLAGKGGSGVVAGSNTQIQFNNSGVFGASSSLTWNGTTLGTTGFTASSDSTFTSTGALTISLGTTAQRPASPTVGMLRYNSTTNQFEGYSGASPSWLPVGGSVISNDTSTVSNLYPLFSSTTSGTATTIYTSNANYLYKPSTGTLSTLFYAATGTITGSLSAGAFSFGTLSYSDVNITMSTTQSVNSYSQQIQQNTSSGTAASADYIVSNNNGTATTYYGDFGITGSGFNTPGQNITNNPNTVYLQSVTADLAIGSLTSGKTVSIYAGGSSTAALSVTSTVTSIVTPVASNGIYMNSTTVSASTTIPTGQNGQSIGPITIPSGVTVTVASGQRWVIQ